MSDWPYFPEVSEKMDPEFMERLIAIRQELNKPMFITSSYRSPDHPIEKKKKNGPGPHSTGRAVDVGISGAAAYQLMELAPMFGFVGIGFKQHGPHRGRFIHLDMCESTPNRPRPHIWSYK